MIELAILLTLLQVFDGWTTYQILQKFGGREKNPVVLWLIEKVGTVYGGLLVAKVGATALVWILVLLNAPFIVLLLLAAAYVWVAQNNYNVYKKLRG